MAYVVELRAGLPVESKQTKEVKPFELPDNENERNLYNIPKPFDSWFEYDITSDLINKGYHFIQPQYKVKEDETFYNHHSQKETYVNFKLTLGVSYSTIGYRESVIYRSRH